ncbi:MAG: hypothetical protein ACOCRK_08110, partial [bacterium]
YVPSYKNNDAKLYLQTVFSSCIIEQVKGWSDFLATIPTYYGIKQVSKRVVEFILCLDVLENQKNKQKIKDEKKVILIKWDNIIKSIYRLIEQISGDVQGLPTEPSILQDLSDISIIIEEKENSYFIDEKRAELMSELLLLELNNTASVGDKIGDNQSEIDRKLEELDKVEFELTDIHTDYKIDSKKLEYLEVQLEEIEKDLVKNKDAKKLDTYGADMQVFLSKNICPTCHQKIKDSLLPQDIEQIPMSIEENIQFLKEQKRMVVFHINIIRKQLKEKENNMRNLKIKLKKLREDIRDLKMELIEDERVPSVTEIKRKIFLQNAIKDYERIEDKFNNYLSDLKVLSNKWKEVLMRDEKLPPQYYSKLDLNKLKDLQSDFRDNVEIFGYKSKLPEEIDISEDKYFPTVDGFDMKFDSSASDHIRAIWAYTCSLYQVSNKYDCNHPNFIIFDEPGQQQMKINHIRKFFSLLSNKDWDCQSIVSTSLEEPNFTLATKDMEYKLIEIKDWALTPSD